MDLMSSIGEISVIEDEKSCFAEKKLSLYSRGDSIFL